MRLPQRTVLSREVLVSLGLAMCSACSSSSGPELRVSRVTPGTLRDTVGNTFEAGCEGFRCAVRPTVNSATPLTCSGSGRTDWYVLFDSRIAELCAVVSDRQGSLQAFKRRTASTTTPIIVGRSNAP
jgi:hypothetical protein